MILANLFLKGGKNLALRIIGVRYSIKSFYSILDYNASVLSDLPDNATDRPNDHFGGVIPSQFLGLALKNEI